MYESCYGLSDDPFRMTLDARLSFPYRSYLEAKQVLEYSLLQGEGLVLLVGAAGSGKTALISELLGVHTFDNYLVIKFAIPPADAARLLRLIIESLEINTQATDKISLLNTLNDYLNHSSASKRNALLIIDRAETIPEPVLEELRRLTSPSANMKPRVQMLLQGQPKLLDTLGGSRMESLNQLLSGAVLLYPLELEETRAFIEHRLDAVDWHGDPEFTDQAFEMIHQISAGVPRQINLICNHLMLYGCSEQKHRIDDYDVRQIIAELPPGLVQSNPFPRRAFQRPMSPANIPAEPNHPPRESHASASAESAAEDSRSVQIPQHSEYETQETRVSNFDGFRISRANDHRETNSASSNSIDSQTALERVALSSPSVDPSAHRLPLREPETRDTTPEAPFRQPLSDQAMRVATLMAPPEPPLGGTAETATKFPLHAKSIISKRRSLFWPIGATIILGMVLAGPYISRMLAHNGRNQSEKDTIDSFRSAYEKLRALQINNQQPTSNQAPRLGDWEQGSAESAEPTSVTAQRDSADDHARQAITNITQADQTASRPDHSSPPQHSDNRDIRDLERDGAPSTHTGRTDIATSQLTPTPHDDGRSVTRSESTTPQISGLNKTRDAVVKQSNKESHSAFTDSGVTLVEGKTVISRSLEHALRRYSYPVERMTDGALQITLAGSTTFESHSPQLQQPAFRNLDRLAFVLRNFDGFEIHSCHARGTFRSHYSKQPSSRTTTCSDHRQLSDLAWCTRPAR